MTISFKQYIEESTFNINMDVDYIYNKAFKQFFNYLNETGKIYPLASMVINSTELPSKISKKASDTNAVMIKCGLFEETCYYNPFEKLIILSPNSSMVYVVRTAGGVENALQYIPSSQLDQFKNELIGYSLKGSIYHELSHWLDDTFHNSHIKNMLLTANKYNNPEYVKYGRTTTFTTPYEINAQIHSMT